MGYDADRTRKTGTYYLKTNSKTPFCGKSFIFPLILQLIIVECLFTPPPPPLPVPARHCSYIIFMLATNSQKAKLNKSISL